MFTIIATITAVFVLIVVLLELLVRQRYRLRNGHSFTLKKRLNWNRSYFQPHPYLPYIYKPKFRLYNPSASYPYPLHHDKYTIDYPLRSNNLGFIDHNEAVVRSSGEISVACLGASTTGNYLSYSDQIEATSYPIELERLLRKAYPGVSVRVNNFGIGGWTTAEIVVNYVLNIHPLNPTFIVIYCGANDLPASYTVPYVTDYSHARKNLGESVWKFQLSRFLPNLPLAGYQLFLQKYWPYLNPRHGILEVSTKGTANYSTTPDMTGYRNNLRILATLASANGTIPLFGTFATRYSQALGSRDDYVDLFNGVDLENAVIRDLVESECWNLVDLERLVPDDESLFVDSMHYSIEGMKFVATMWSETIQRLIHKSNWKS